MKAIIFDLDGTLLYTLKDLHTAINKMLKKHDLETVSLEKMRQSLSYGPKKLIELTSGISQKDEKFSSLYTDYLKYYAEHACDQTIVYPGITKLLTKLKNDNYLLLVLSNKQHQDTVKVIDQFLPNYFSEVYGTSKEIIKKPNPSGILTIMKKYNLSKDDVIYVGDSEVDFQTYTNAEIMGVNVAYGYRTTDELKKSGVFHIVANPDELYDFIKSKF